MKRRPHHFLLQDVEELDHYQRFFRMLKLKQALFLQATALP
jgi:hypothetical protein